MNIVKVRWGKKVSLGDGGDDELMRKVRAHGNFVETVPMILFLMVISELSGAPFWALHILGGLALVARISHYIGVTTGSGHGKFRFYGMVMTIIVFVLGALLNLWLAWPMLFAV